VFVYQPCHGSLFNVKKLESASAWENVGISALESAGTAGITREIGGDTIDENGNTVAKSIDQQSFGQIAGSVLARGAINTTGAFTSNALLKKGAQQSWGSVLEEGMINTAVDAATTSISYGIASSENKRNMNDL